MNIIYSRDILPVMMISFTGCIVCCAVIYSVVINRGSLFLINRDIKSKISADQYSCVYVLFFG